MKELVLVTGGARSGKSALAERLARAAGRVLFVATAEAGDEEMEARIEAHKAARPETWDTAEEPLHLVNVLAEKAASYDLVLIDCLTLWVSNLLLSKPDEPDQERRILGTAEKLLATYEAGRATWVVVSNEVGLGVVPPTELGRQYRDLLGRVNQLLARKADRVYLAVAGLSLELKSLGAKEIE